MEVGWMYLTMIVNLIVDGDIFDVSGRHCSPYADFLAESPSAAKVRFRGDLVKGKWD
jgi:hypothetical protein